MKHNTVTLRQVSSCDTVAFLARLFMVFVWILLSVVVVSVVLGGTRPRESPAEIAFIMVCFTAAFLLVIVVRRAKVDRLLSEGIPVSAVLTSYSRFQCFVTLGIEFLWRGKQKKRMVQLPALCAARVIKKGQQVTLMVDPEDYRRLVIRELYSGSVDDPRRESASLQMR